jgi:hypothetical protein
MPKASKLSQLSTTLPSENRSIEIPVISTRLLVGGPSSYDSPWRACFAQHKNVASVPAPSPSASGPARDLELRFGGVEECLGYEVKLAEA